MFGMKVPDSPNRLVTQADVDKYAKDMDAYITNAENLAGDPSLFKRDRQDLKAAPMTWTGRVTVRQLEKLLDTWKNGISQRIPKI